jgi:hypothetical protein
VDAHFDSINVRSILFHHYYLSLKDLSPMAELFFWDPEKHGLPKSLDETSDFLEHLFELEDVPPSPKFLLATQRMTLLRPVAASEAAQGFQGGSIWWQDPIHCVPSNGAVMVINFKGDENIDLVPLAAEAATQVGLVAYEENFNEIYLPDSYVISE